MGKIKKQKFQKAGPKIPFEEQLSDAIPQKFRNKIRNRKDDDEDFVEARLSEKILDQARKQQKELEDETFESTSSTTARVALDVEGSDDEVPDAGGDFDYENIVVDENEEKALEVFMNKNPVPRLTLADIIKEKITEKQTELQSQFSENCSVNIQDVDPKIKVMYEGVRDVLAKYRSGKVPKAFKMIPQLRNWEQILYITEPVNWSASSVYMATRIFASNLKEKMAQRFYNLVLLPRIRDDITEYKRLNFYLYQALRKALFKPGAFMKGILIPLCESGTCTLREAIIVSSVLATNSIPMLHSAATILKLAEMDYTGSNSIFLRTLFDKKYALPFRVVDAAVFHFLRFEKDKRELPVLWHQALLSFVQRYKGDISSEQKDALLQLLRSKSHPTITPEIRRELMNAETRDVSGIEPQKMEEN